jgi:alpha-ketoglutarate-dependent taurine dioxygenase
VVVTGPTGQRRLAGFYQASEPVPIDEVRAALARRLADYMVPAQLRALDRLPLTGNGKVDRKALRDLAAEPAPAITEPSRPAGPTQQRIAAAWESVLRLPAGRIGPADDFFAVGGTSLAALRAVVLLDRLFSLPDLVEHPVLHDLAAMIDARDAAPAAPVIIQAGAGPQEDWLAGNRALLRRTVEEHGAVLIRGLRVTEPAGLSEIAARLDLTPMTHREGFAARDSYGKNVFSSAEWPPDQPMCMHHENSYQDEFPGLLALACLTPPTSGGVTGLADAALMAAELPADLVESFDRRGWQLVRNYTGMIGVDWREAFGVTDRAAAEQYCRAHGIDFSWRDDGSLTTRQRRPAVLRHPVSGVRTWFNQIAFLNEWTLDPTIREYLLYEFGPDGLPFNTCYGDGEPIDEAIVKTINTTYEKLTVRTPWQAGDVLLVDNVRMAHSREAYEGNRRIAMLLAEPGRRGDE